MKTITLKIYNDLVEIHDVGTEEILYPIYGDEYEDLVSEVGDAVKDYLRDYPNGSEKVPPDPEVLFLYKEYDDSMAYGEEFTKLFRSYRDACAFLEKRFCEQMHVESLEAFKKTLVLQDETTDDVDDYMSDDTVSEDYISLSTGNGVQYWIVEAEPVIEEENI